MEEALYIAEPIKEYNALILLIGCLIALIIFLWLVQSNKLKGITGPFRQIALLLGGLGTLIVLATTVFTAWNLHTIQPIRLYSDYMETFHGKTNYKEIARAGIYKDQQNSFINPQVSIRKDELLVVETRDKKVMLFADDNYNIQELVKKIRERMDKK